MSVTNHSSCNRRAFTRVPIELASEVRGEGLAFRCRTKDVSFKGLFLLTDEQIAVGTLLSVTIALSTDGSVPPLKVDARVTDLRQNGLGCEITTIHEPTSFHYLRQFVLHNAADAETALREIDRYLQNLSDEG